MDNDVFYIKRSLVKLMSGRGKIIFSDSSILEIASSLYDASDSDFEKKKRLFLKDIHDMLDY